MRQRIKPTIPLHPVMVFQRLLLRLTELAKGKRLIILHAPTGFGKSVLLLNFAISTPLPVVWYSLSENERDPLALVKLLAFGLSEQFSSLRDRKIHQMMSGGNLETSVEYLVSLLASLPPHIMVFDDVFCAEGVGFGTVMTKLLDAKLPQTKIILAVRSRAGLDLSTILDYIEQGQVGGIGEDELAVSPEECRGLLMKWFGMEATLDEADEITLLTGGNIAEILVAAHLGPPAEQIRLLKNNLVAQHIVEGLEFKLQQFLLKTISLPYLTVELCQKLKIKNPMEQIDKLQSMGLVTKSGGKFFFVESLVGALGGMVTASSLIAVARILEERGDYIEVGNLLAKGGTWDEMAALLGRRGQQIYDNGQAQQLGGWLGQLPTRYLDDKLKLLYGRVLVNDMGQPDIAFILFSQVRQHGDSPAIKAQARVWQSVALKAAGEPAEALTAAMEGVEELESLGGDPALVTQALRILGHAHRAAGNLNMHVLYTRRALGIYEAMGDPWGIAQSHHDCGVGMAQLGQVEGARYHYNQAILTWQKLGAGSDLANTLNSVGLNYYLRGEYGLAESHLQEALSIASQSQATRRIAFALSGLGDVALARGEYETARSYFERSTQNAQRASARALEVFNTVRLGECCLGAGEIDRAMALAEQAGHTANEKKYQMETGLAYLLRGQIYLRLDNPYQAAHWLQQAVDLLGQNDRFEEIRARLWLALALLRDQRRQAARQELDMALVMIKELPGLIGGLGREVPKLTDLFDHFYQAVSTSEGIKDGLILLGYRPSARGVQFYGLGEPVLAVNGRHWQFSSRWRVIGKTPELLSYILMERCEDGCSREAIQAALWPELGPVESYDRLHQNIKRLRATQFESCPQGGIEIKGEFYSFRADWSDILIFKRLLQAIKLASNPDEVLELRLELISLYRGEFLKGFDVGEWGANAREFFESRFMQHLTLAVRELLHRQKYEMVLELAHKGLEIDPFQDELQQTYITVRNKLGIKTDLYIEKISTLFEAELGYTPDFRLDADPAAFLELSLFPGEAVLAIDG